MQQKQLLFGGKMTKKYCEIAIARLRAVGIDARGVNLFGRNGIHIKQGLFGEAAYTWRDLRRVIREMKGSGI